MNGGKSTGEFTNRIDHTQGTVGGNWKCSGLSRILFCASSKYLSSLSAITRGQVMVDLLARSKEQRGQM